MAGQRKVIRWWFGSLASIWPSINLVMEDKHGEQNPTGCGPFCFLKGGVDIQGRLVRTCVCVCECV